MKIKEVSITNYKSIRECVKLQLGEINILVGSNGVGKTNFISFLKLFKQIADNKLQSFVAEGSGANKMLHFGRKISETMEGMIHFDSNNAYRVVLKPTDSDNFYFEKEETAFLSGGWHKIKVPTTGYPESKIDELITNHIRKRGFGGIPQYVKSALQDFEIYHFHDTSKSSPIKQSCKVHDNRFLRPNGSNIAAFLYYLQEKHPVSLKLIEGTIRQIAPFFDTFSLSPNLLDQEEIRLVWHEKNSDAYFDAHQLSDGTIRMIALATLLLQPNPPDTIIIDEPELGLHPAAINLLAGLIRKCSKKTQIIVSTQSVTLVNQFSPEDLIIVERQENQTVFKQLSEEQISSWLEDYSLGDAWEKNVIGGRP